MSLLASDVAVGVLLLAWLLFSALNQVRSLSIVLGRYDPVCLLPRWTFFAPNPGIFDSHLVFRCIPDIDGSTSVEELLAEAPWREVRIEDLQPILPFVWNPARRLTKTVSDALNGLIMHNKMYAHSKSTLKYTVNYLLLCNLVQRQVIEGQALYQWGIVRAHGFNRERHVSLLFLSDLHRLA